MVKRYFVIFLVMSGTLPAMDLPNPRIIKRFLSACLCCESPEIKANRNARKLWQALDDGAYAIHIEQLMAEMHDEPVNAQYKIADSAVTLLNFTIMRGNVPLLAFLLEKNASIKTDDGYLPLIKALDYSIPEKRHKMVALLLEKANANPLKKNKSGISPLQYAHTIKDIKAIKLLDAALSKRNSKAQYMLIRTVGNGHPFPNEVAAMIAQKTFEKPSEISKNFR
jgi:ankyrin repeat protein